MIIYRIRLFGCMGFTEDEEFWASKPKAIQAFNKKIKEFRKDGYLAKKDDLPDNVKPIDIIKPSKSDNFIKRAFIHLWYKTSYEYNEWDIETKDLILTETEVKEG